MNIFFTPSKIPAKHEEQVLLQKLEAKNHYLQKGYWNGIKNNFEALLFQQLAYVFGLKSKCRNLPPDGLCYRLWYH